MEMLAMNTNKLVPQLPANIRLINASLQQLVDRPITHFSLERVLNECQLNQLEFNHVFHDVAHLLQASCRQFYETTKTQLATWAINQEDLYSSRVSFEAYLYALNVFADLVYYQQLHHIMIGGDTVWSQQSTKSSYGFTQLYFDDCWYSPLLNLLQQIMPVKQAKELAIKTRCRLQTAAITSVEAIATIMQELRESLPTLYALTNNH